VSALTSALEWAVLQAREWDREREKRPDQFGRDYYEQAARHLRTLIEQARAPAEDAPPTEGTL
jgi:hypothetical protein